MECHYLAVLNNDFSTHPDNMTPKAMSSLIKKVWRYALYNQTERQYKVANQKNVVSSRIPSYGAKKETTINEVSDIDSLVYRALYYENEDSEDIVLGESRLCDMNSTSSICAFLVEKGDSGDVVYCVAGKRENTFTLCALLESFASRKCRNPF